MQRVQYYVIEYGVYVSSQLDNHETRSVPTPFGTIKPQPGIQAVMPRQYANRPTTVIITSHPNTAGARVSDEYQAPLNNRASTLRRLSTLDNG
jgi:hypothetical protein